MTPHPNLNEIYQGDALAVLNTFPDKCIDCIITDPPYGYSFMNKDWDRAVVAVDTWKECYRVLKSGSFAAVMSSPRQDVLARMIINLQDAGFRTDFTSIYWTYASGFPKAANISKLVDKRKGTTPQQSREFAEYIKQKRNEVSISITKMDQFVCNGTTNYSWFEGRPVGQRLPRLEEYYKIKQILQLDNRYDDFMGEAEREVIGQKTYTSQLQPQIPHVYDGKRTQLDITKSSTQKAKSLDGSFAGFQPKPAVEVILIVMKPLSEKSYVDQALSNSKGVTWLDSCRIPFQGEDDSDKSGWQHYDKNKGLHSWNELKVREGDRKETVLERSDRLQSLSSNSQGRFPANLLVSDDVLNDDSGPYSRFFDLDKWFCTIFPFLATPKASPSERGGKENNKHPTVKPLKLMSWLITLLTRPKDTVLDPFCGSGTTCLSAKLLKRNYTGIELNPEYVEIANRRLART